MATKKIRLPISIGIRDEAASQKQLLDKDGRQVHPDITVLKHVPAGQLVELDAEEADRLLAKFGPYTETVVVTDTPTGVVPAGPPVQSVRR